MSQPHTSQPPIEQPKEKKERIALPVIGTIIFILFWASYSGISKYFTWLNTLYIFNDEWFSIMAKSVIPWYLFIFYFLRKYKSVPNAWHYMMDKIKNAYNNKSETRVKKGLSILLVLTDILIPIIAAIAVCIITILWLIYSLSASAAHKATLEASRDFIYCFFINIPLAIKTLQNSYIGFKMV